MNASFNINLYKISQAGPLVTKVRQGHQHAEEASYFRTYDRIYLATIYRSPSCCAMHITSKAANHHHSKGFGVVPRK